MGVNRGVISEGRAKCVARIVGSEGRDLNRII